VVLKIKREKLDRESKMTELRSKNEEKLNQQIYERTQA
jgi:hypothetical protein